MPRKGDCLPKDAGSKPLKTLNNPRHPIGTPVGYLLLRSQKPEAREKRKSVRTTTKTGFGSKPLFLDEKGGTRGSRRAKSLTVPSSEALNRPRLWLGLKLTESSVKRMVR